MEQKEKYYKISESDLRRYINDSLRLCCLENDGVDNWEGYMISYDEFIANALGVPKDEVEENDYDFEDIVDRVIAIGWKDSELK